MKFLRDLNLGARLGMAFAALILLGTIVTAFGVSQLASLSESLALISEDRVPKVQHLANVTDDVNLIARELRNTLIFDDERVVDQAIQISAGCRKRIAETFDEISPSIRSDEGKRQLQATLDARAAFVPHQNKFMDLIREGKRTEAEELLVTQMRSAQLGYMNALDDFKDYQVGLITASALAGKQDYLAARTRLLGLLLGMTLLGGLLAWRITRSVTVPLREAVAVAEMVAEGDLTSKIEVERQDETGRLLTALGSMNESLADVVLTVRSSSDSIAGGSSSIAEGNSHLSQRTEEQARSLQQTAASMEELNVTVNLNADNARQATELAKSACDIASKGGEAVREVVGAMKGVSDSSKKISDIISVIDSIAFQTNILALNAAVEAARAGEHGKGFAVVAQEVGDLASRSSDAALEIRSLIDESGQCVMKGAQLVDEAGQTMEDIVESVQKVTALMEDISIASDEQSKGVNQVGHAMHEIDRVTQQNTVMVEQSATAADTLQNEVHQLVNAVAIFKMQGNLKGESRAA